MFIHYNRDCSAPRLHCVLHDADEAGHRDEATASTGPIVAAEPIACLARSGRSSDLVGLLLAASLC